MATNAQRHEYYDQDEHSFDSSILQQEVHR